MPRFFGGVFAGVLVMGAAGFGLERAVFGPAGGAEVRAVDAAWERQYRGEVLRRQKAEQSAEECSLRLIAAELRVLELHDAARREQMKARPPVVRPEDRIPPPNVPER